MAGTLLRQRTRERLLNLTRAELDPVALRLEVVDELSRAVGFAFWCWTLVDPDTRVPTGGMSEALPFLPDFPRYISLAERVPETDLEAYQVAAGAEMLKAQERRLSELRASGIHATEVVPNELAAEIINQYLDVKARHLL